MKTFIHTGFHSPTFTTCDDPLLKVTERDNGVRWILDFEVGETTIDMINLEYPKGREIHNDVKSLPVYNEENVIIGTVESVLLHAIQLDLDLDRINMENLFRNNE